MIARDRADTPNWSTSTASPTYLGEDRLTRATSRTHGGYRHLPRPRAHHRRRLRGHDRRPTTPGAPTATRDSSCSDRRNPRRRDHAEPSRPRRPDPQQDAEPRPRSRAARRHRRRRRRHIITRLNNRSLSTWQGGTGYATATSGPSPPSATTGPSPSHATTGPAPPSAPTEPSWARGRGRRFGGTIVLPASYVAEHVDLGYAVTAYRARKASRPTLRTSWSTLTSTRETFYVAMTRGRHANHAYVTLDRADDHAQPHPGDDRVPPREACSTAFSTAGLSLGARDHRG